VGSGKRTTGPLDRVIEFRGGGQISITDKAFREFLDVLSKLNLFDGMTISEISEICSKLWMYRYSHNEILLEQGKRTEQFFIIFSGVVKIYVNKGILGRPVEVAQVQCGGLLGEMAMVTGRKCSATVVAEQDVKVFAGDKALFDELIETNNSFAENLKGILFERDNPKAARQVPDHYVPDDIEEPKGPISEPSEYESRTIFVPRMSKILSMDTQEKYQFREMLKDHYLFDRIPKKDLRRLISTADHVEYPTGEILIRQGYLGSAIYVFSEGRVSVRASDERGIEKKDEVARLGTGDVCGEMSVILSEPATASVVALQRVTAYVISREVFSALVDSNEEFANAVYALAMERKSVQLEKKSPR